MYGCCSSCCTRCVLASAQSCSHALEKAVNLTEDLLVDVLVFKLLDDFRLCPGRALSILKLSLLDFFPHEELNDLIHVHVLDSFLKHCQVVDLGGLSVSEMGIGDRLLLATVVGLLFEITFLLLIVSSKTLTGANISLLSNEAVNDGVDFRWCSCVVVVNLSALVFLILVRLKRDAASNKNDSGDKRADHDSDDHTCFC